MQDGHESPAIGVISSRRGSNRAVASLRWRLQQDNSSGLLLLRDSEMGSAKNQQWLHVLWVGADPRRRRAASSGYGCVALQGGLFVCVSKWVGKEPAAEYAGCNATEAPVCMLTMFIAAPAAVLLLCCCWCAVDTPS